MRITVKLDGFEGAQSAAYAILWLDRESSRWSREGHQSMDVPDWGDLTKGAGDTVICGQDAPQPICVLEQLDFDVPGGPPEGLAGRALWYTDQSGAQSEGRWHVQCIDRAQIKAEHGVFAGEEVNWTAL
ncbi:DUF3564 family protein [Caballeronia sp. GAWG2-1]|uniref:DUF3564 family protein n=1 Tax=Caballeronia sp. GAWG2-1 TaxID=2921744 RepID=UPI002028115A|nr:DUF3564 family protein [Caballeronia sp. GAWG2-1]